MSSSICPIMLFFVVVKSCYEFFVLIQFCYELFIVVQCCFVFFVVVQCCFVFFISILPPPYLRLFCFEQFASELYPNL